MKIGVISDTHIPEKAQTLPKPVLEALRQVDMIIHAGDLTSPELLVELKRICPNVKAVYGNMDSFEVRKSLPDKQLLELKGFKIGITHGYGHPNQIIDIVTQAFQEEKPDMIIFGHSHTALNMKKGKTIYFNPGSPTDNIFSPYKSYGIIEVSDKLEAKIIKI